MNIPFKRGLQLMFLCAAMTGCGGASDMTTVGYTAEVEIAPGKWLSVEGGSTVHASDLRPNRKDPHKLSPLDALEQIIKSGSSGGGGADAERSSLSFAWNGKQVAWKGKEIPITLREYDGTLYMIGFNRANAKKKRFVYFRLNAKGAGFRKIKPRDFPKPIATQNMWLQGSRTIGIYTAETGTQWVDTWQMLRQLDIDSPAFGTSMTARIWYQLSKGLERHEMPFNIPRDFLREYVRTYKPIALPTLIKEKTPDVATPEPNEPGSENDRNAAKPEPEEGSN